MNFSLRASAVAFLAVLICSPMVWARRAQVTKIDGNVIVGEVVDESEKAIVLKISGISTTISRNNISKIKFLKTLEESYAEQRAKLKDSDGEGRYSLAQQMFEQKAYHIALKELDSLIRDFPDVKKYKLLKDLVQLRIDKAQGVKPVTPVKPVKPANGDKPRVKPKRPFGKLPVTRLEDSDINLIRIYEIDFRDKKKPMVKIPRDTMNDFFEEFKDKDSIPKTRAARTRFVLQPGWQQLRAIMNLANHGARDFYADVVVKDDPPALKSFRLQVHNRLIINYCATGGCHGGPNSGKMFLFKSNPNDIKTVYTNFYILHKKETTEGKVIDRDAPAESLLLHYSLPRSQTDIPHPEVDGGKWKSAFRSSSDRTYRAVSDWIRTLYHPVPSYGIKYELPVVDPTRKAAPAKGGDTTKTPAEDDANK